jgi:hypothetical protein
MAHLFRSAPDLLNLHQAQERVKDLLWDSAQRQLDCNSRREMVHALEYSQCALDPAHAQKRLKEAADWFEREVAQKAVQS